MPGGEIGVLLVGLALIALGFVTDSRARKSDAAGVALKVAGSAIVVYACVRLLL